LPSSLSAQVKIEPRLSHRMGAIIFQHFEAFNYSRISNANTCSIHVFIVCIPGIFLLPLAHSLSQFSTVWAITASSSLFRQVDCLLSSFDFSWYYSKCYATNLPLKIKYDKGNVAPFFLWVHLRPVFFYGLMLINSELGALIRANIGVH